MDKQEHGKVKYHYYYHCESDSLWKSNLDLEEEGNPDGCTEPIDKQRALELKKQLGLKRIPKYINRKLISE